MKFTTRKQTNMCTEGGMKGRRIHLLFNIWRMILVLLYPENVPFKMYGLRKFVGKASQFEYINSDAQQEAH